VHTQSSAFINVILVYSLLFVSGAHRYSMNPNGYLVLVFFLALAAWYLFTDRKISSQYLLYMMVFVSLLFLLSIYTNGSLSLQSLLATTMKFVLAYLILKTVGEKFVDTYINVMVFLAAVSLPGYLIDVFGLFDQVVTKLPAVGNMGYEGVLYIFRHGYHPDRNNSIFFEPGAYQGFINSALFLILFARPHFGSRRKWVYIVILIAALITASSTTGFIIFSLLFALFLYKSDLATRSQKVVTVGLIVVIVTVFAAQFREALVDKLDDYVNPTLINKGYSAGNRSFDLQTDLKIIQKHVFGLGYDEYKKEFSRINRVPITEGSSNGVTSMLANYGVPYGLFVLISYFWALRKLMGDLLLTTVAYIMFMMFLWGESYYQIAPISFAIIAAAFVFTPLPGNKAKQPRAEVQQQSRVA